MYRPSGYPTGKTISQNMSGPRMIRHLRRTILESCVLGRDQNNLHIREPRINTGYSYVVGEDMDAYKDGMLVICVQVCMKSI